jgi:hypothetical protein
LDQLKEHHWLHYSKHFWMRNPPRRSARLEKLRTPPPPRARLTPETRLLLIQEYTLLVNGANRQARQVALNTICQKFRIHRTTLMRTAKKVEKTLKTGDLSHVQTKPRSGRPTVMTPRKVAKLQQVATENGFDMSFREMGASLGVSPSTIHKHVHLDGWHVVKSQTRPLLTATQRQQRLDWATIHRKSTWEAWVDVDEKWFHTLTGCPLKVPPGQSAPKFEVKSKSHIPKVMMLSAIAKPKPRAGFNGLIGIWRVAQKHTAKRRSKNHQKGAKYDKDCTMDSNLFYQMMTEKVIPAIRSKMTWATKVYIQIDNASPHTGRNTVSRIQQHADRSKSKTRIELVLQPPQSPDTNANDLGFFNSLQTRVRKLNRQFRSLDKEKLAERVVTEFENYPPEILRKLFETKSLVLRTIYQHSGSNDFVLPHSQAL